MMRDNLLLMKSIVEREFPDVMRLNELNPNLFTIIRYRHAIPQYGIESREELEALEQLQLLYKGLIIGGNLRDGNDG